MPQDELVKLQKIIPEVNDYDEDIIEIYYEIAEKKHGQDNILLKFYYLGWLLTSLEQDDFTTVSISNITLQEENKKNKYYILYNQLLEELKEEGNIANISLI